MKRSDKFANPFYALLLVAGIAFALTATAYGVMAFRERDTKAAPASTASQNHPLISWLREHGETTLMAELGLLAVGTFAAIGTDDYWQRRAKPKKSNIGPQINADARR